MVWHGMRTSAYCTVARGMSYCDVICYAAMIAVIDWLSLAIYDTGMHLIKGRGGVARKFSLDDLADAGFFVFI